MGTYVDECLNAGDLGFEKLTELTLSKFDSKLRVYYSFEFFGTKLEPLNRGCFHVSQKYYATDIKLCRKEQLV